MTDDFIKKPSFFN